MIKSSNNTITTTRKVTMTLLSLLFVSSSVLFNTVEGFQFMKNWKLPTRDRVQEAVDAKFGDKKLVVITDVTSELGKQTTEKLLATNEYHVIGGTTGTDSSSSSSSSFASNDNFTPIECNMNSFDSVHQFCNEINEYRIDSKPIDRLICICNTIKANDSSSSSITHDGILKQNYLSPFIITSKLLDAMEDSFDGRVTMVGTSPKDVVVAEDVVEEEQAEEDSSQLILNAALDESKFKQKLLTTFLHTKYHKLTQNTFNNYEVPEEVDDTTSSAVVDGLFQVVHDSTFATKSGVSLTCSNNNNNVVEVDEIMDGTTSGNNAIFNIDTAYELFKQSEEQTNSQYPQIRQVTSPCPTLKVIGAVTKGQVQRQEMKRMREMGRPGISEAQQIQASKLTKRQKVANVADKVVSKVLKHTVGRVARVASTKLLGHMPEEAITGSFDKIDENDIDEIQQVISEQIIQEANNKAKLENKKLVVVTGCSSGLGRKTALALLRSGEYHVIGAVRDLDKMEAVAEIDGFDMDNFTPMYCEMCSFDSVRQFCDNVNKFRGDKPLDRLVCNAGVYQPSLRYAKWSKDGHEQTMQINFLSHFLMSSILMKAMEGAINPRVIMVGSVTGNDNTVGGGGVYPIADLHDLDGFDAGFQRPIEMADGYGFIGAKAYKDSKLCLMIMANFLHAKYHKTTGITFSSMYPGCIAESPLFREKRPWFRKYFPIFMKFITGGYVGEHEAGQRLFQVCHDPRCAKSGVYWSWNGGPREGRGAEAIEKGGQISGGGGAGGGWDSIFENDQSNKVLNIDTGFKLFQSSSKITNAQWPEFATTTTTNNNNKIEVTTTNSNSQGSSSSNNKNIIVNGSEEQQTQQQNNNNNKEEVVA